MAMTALPCCPVCEVQLPSFCPVCVQNSIAEKRHKLKSAAGKRDVVKEKLNKRLAAVGAADDQRRWRIEWAEARAHLQDQIRKTTDELARGMEKLERRKRNVKIRSSQLADANTKLYSKCHEILVQYFPDALRSESLRHTFVTSELTRLRRQTIQKLRSVLPLRLTLMDVGSSMRQYVTICGIRLPDGTDPTLDGGPEVSAALGYLLQFVGMATTYLGAPILHVAGHGVSSSSIWQRESYWKTKNSSASYPLYLPRTGSASASRSSSLYSSQTAHHDKKPSPPPEPASPAEPALSKSASETRAEKDGGSAPRVDPDSVPDRSTPEFLASMPVDGTASWAQASFTRQAGLVMAESLTAAKAAARAPHQSAANRHSGLLKSMPPVERSVGGRARQASRGGERKDADLEGWDFVDRPMDILPPPPSEPDNIAHWTRAMFLDARK